MGHVSGLGWVAVRPGARKYCWRLKFWIMDDSCDEWEADSDCAGFEFPFVLTPKRRKIFKSCGKRQAVAKDVSVTLNTIAEDDSEGPFQMFTNAPRTFVCETRGRTPKKSHKNSPVANRKRLLEEGEIALSLTQYEGFRSENGLGESEHVADQGSSSLCMFLDNIAEQSKSLHCDVQNFESFVHSNHEDWKQLRQECLVVLEELNVAYNNSACDASYTESEEAFRLGIQFIKELEWSMLLNSSACTKLCFF